MKKLFPILCAFAACCSATIIIFLSSCSSREVVIPENIISVNLNFADKFGDESLFIDSDTAILYRLPQEPIIGDIIKIRESNETLYILDNSHKCIFRFVTKTNSLNGFCQYGPGPGEYSFITDYFVYDDKIYILDNYSNKINIYQNDQCIRTIPVNEDVWANEIFVLDDYLFLINHSSNPSLGKYHLFRISPSGEIKKFLPFDEVPGLVSNCSYAIGNNFAYYVEPSDNIIYKVTSDRVEPLYYVDFGEYNLPKEYYSSNMYELMNNGIDKEYATGIDKIKYGDDLFFLYFEIKGKKYQLVFNTLTNSTIVFCEMFKPMDDILYGLSPISFDICGNALYDWKTTDYFDPIFEFIGLPKANGQYKTQLEELRDEMNPEDNPFIFKYYLKNNAK